MSLNRIEETCLQKTYTPNLPRTNHRGQEYIALPPSSTEALVDPSADVAGDGAEQHPGDQRAGHERAAVRRREETEAGERQRHQRHAEHLQ